MDSSSTVDMGGLETGPGAFTCTAPCSLYR